MIRWDMIQVWDMTKLIFMIQSSTHMVHLAGILHTDDILGGMWICETGLMEETFRVYHKYGI